MSDYKVRRGGREYPAKDLDEIRTWAQQGNVGPADEVWSAATGRWIRAKDLPAISSSLPAPSHANTLIGVGAALVLAGSVIPHATLFLFLGIVVLIVGVVRRK